MIDHGFKERDGSEVTTYPDFAVEFRAASHRYWLWQEGERTSIPSVTTAMKVLAKDNLIPWAEQMGVEGALRLERAGELQGVGLTKATYRMRELGEGFEAVRNRRSDEGTAIHDVLSAYCEGTTIPPLGEYSEAARGYASALYEVLLDKEPEPIIWETVVGSPEYGFAGRLDLIAIVGNRMELWDLKTSKRYARVFKEAHAQTQAYRLALPECGLPVPDVCKIVALGEDGSHRIVESQGTSEQFLAVLGCFNAMKGLDGAIKAAEREAVG